MSRVIKALIIIFCATGTIMLNVFQSAMAESSMLPIRPSLSIHYDMFGASYAIYLNDVLIVESTRDTHAISYRPVDLFFKEGENEVRLELGPRENSSELSEYLEVGIRFALDDLNYPPPEPPARFSEEITLATINAKGQHITEAGVTAASTPIGERLWGRETDNPLIAEVGPVIVEPSMRFKNGKSIRRTVTTNIPFFKWEWLTSEIIENNESTKQSLLKEYSKVWNIMDKMDEEALDRFSVEAIEQTNLSRHLPKDFIISKKGYFDSIKEDNDIFGGISLDSIDADKAVLRLHGGDRLAELVKYENRYKPLIIWHDETRKLAKPYNMMFRRENGQWIRTR